MTWGSGRCSKLRVEGTGEQGDETRRGRTEDKETEGQGAVSILLGRTLDRACQASVHPQPHQPRNPPRTPGL